MAMPRHSHRPLLPSYLHRPLLSHEYSNLLVLLVPAELKTISAFDVTGSRETTKNKSEPEKLYIAHTTLVPRLISGSLIEQGLAEHEELCSPAHQVPASDGPTRENRNEDYSSSAHILKRHSSSSSCVLTSTSSSCTTGSK